MTFLGCIFQGAIYSMSRPRIFVLVLVVALCSGLAAAFLASQWTNILSSDLDDQFGAEVATVALEHRDLRTYEELSGILDYPDSFQVMANNTGVLTYIIPEGSRLARGSVLFRVYSSVTDLDRAIANQQKASADAAVAQAELTLENFNAPATLAQVASADAAIAQAELALENLNAPATLAQVASADAAIAQAETNLVGATGNLDTIWASLETANRAYCDDAKEIRTNKWEYWGPFCSAEEQASIFASAVDEEAESAIQTLLSVMFLNDQMVSVSTTVLREARNYRSALASFRSVTESLLSTQEKRMLLDDLPTTAELKQAHEALRSAREQRDSLEDSPTPQEIEQLELSLESARSALLTANLQLEELKDGPTVGLLMFGEVPAWREFRRGMTPGVDIEQLKGNLAELGYGFRPGFRIDQHFDKLTADAVRGMQKDLGVGATGRIAFGEIIFLPGVAAVEFSASFPNIGATVNSNTTLLSLIPTERTITRIDRRGMRSYFGQSLQKVDTSIPVGDQELIEVGSEVKIELPDEQVVLGSVSEIGRIAVIPKGNEAGNPYLEVTVALTGQDFPQWTGATVVISVTKELAQGVLCAPVTSLLAILGGGYALEVVESQAQGTRLVPVETGVYADGWVEVTGPGLQDGTVVVTAN